MFKAKVKFLKIINEIASNNLDFQLITNNQGKLVLDTQLAMQELVGQLTSPVRWDLCQETIKNAGVTGLLELAPGGTLVGIAKREIPGVELFAVKSLDDIPTGIDFIRKHTSE
jgi:[acyl-carrier-protein] S-malonyltransferase